MELLPDLFNAFRSSKVFRYVINRFLRFTFFHLLHSQGEVISDSEWILVGCIDVMIVCFVHLHTADCVLFVTSLQPKHPPREILSFFMGAASNGTNEGVTVRQSGDEMSTRNKVRTNYLEEVANPRLS